MQNWRLPTVWVIAVGTWVTSGAGPAHAQVPPPAGGWAPATATANSSDLSRGAQDGTGQGTLSLSAVLSDEGQPIERGLAWYAFGAVPDTDGKRVLVVRSVEAAPQFTLPSGDYFVTATFGRATLTRKYSIAAGQPQADKFNLEAGGLNVRAILPSGEPAPDRTVTFDVFNEERDQSGNRVKVIAGAKPGLILRLNAGIYQVVTTYGDANARVRAEVTVYPGKLTEATLSQTGAKITFKLVARAGGEALADVAWSIIDTKAQTVKETAGAVPTHILAAGRYAVLAKHQGKTFRVEFSAKPGDSTVVEVVAR